MGYVPGDTVVHPQHGAATVVGIVKKDVGNGPEGYLELLVAAPTMRILVPERSLREVGVRSLSSRMEAEAALAVLQAPSDVPSSWSERNVFTASRMRSRDLDQRSMVIRDLTRHVQRTGKPLTMGEGRALEHCLEMVSKELSLTLGISEEDTKALMIEKSLLQEAPSHVA